jgi:uncharacterized membrane protein HdeD (DUF308 family)
MAGQDRRQRKPDVWSRVMRGVALLVYPVLIVNLFIFATVAGEAQKRQVVNEASRKDWAPVPLSTQNTQMARLAMQNLCGWVNLYAFLPVMTVGLLIGIGGIILSRKRARRRYDYKFQNQLILVVLSVVGLVVYLAVPW